MQYSWKLPITLFLSNTPQYVWLEKRKEKKEKEKKKTKRKENILREFKLQIFSAVADI